MNIERLRRGLRSSDNDGGAISFAVWLYYNKITPLKIERGERASDCVERTCTDEELMGLYARWILEKSNET